MRVAQNDRDSDKNLPKWLPAAVLLVAVGGFMLLAWYSYNNVGKQAVKDEELLVVEADKTPMKEKPLNAGGMQFPNQDKTIYETFAKASSPLARVERVLPPPEEPMKQVATPTPAPIIEEKPTEKPAEVATIKIAETPKPIEKITEKPVDQKGGVSQTPIVKPKQIKSKLTERGIKIQLGAYTSEEEAKKDWVRIQKKFALFSGKSPQIGKTTVNGKIFYRLRVGGFSSENAAKSICSTISAKGQGCILAKK